MEDSSQAELDYLWCRAGVSSVYCYTCFVNELKCSLISIYGESKLDRGALLIMMSIIGKRSRVKVGVTTTGQALTTGGQGTHN